MEECGLQSDGTYAVCFKNYNKIQKEEVGSIFSKYGDIVSIRQSTEAIPWVFIRYINQEEAMKALHDLQGYKDFDIRLAKSHQKKKPDQVGDREKSDSYSDGLSDSKSMKGGYNRNRGSEKFIMDSEDNDSYDNRKVSYNRKPNNFMERPFKNKEEDNFNHYDKMSDSEGARALSPNRGMGFQRSLRSPNEKQVRGRDQRVGMRRSSENSRSVDESPPRLVKKSPGNQRVNGTIEVGKPGIIPDDGPPKLVKGSEFYANSKCIADSATHGLALLAAREEVWENHPLHSEMTLKEIIIANFEYMPSKKDIYELCLPVKPLHVSFGTTPAGSFYSRVLLASEKEAEQLRMLNGEEELIFTTLEDLLDEIFFIENGE